MDTTIANDHHLLSSLGYFIVYFLIAQQ